MPYWMTNPDHGTMPVYDMGEVERVKKFGWTLLNVGESPIVPVVNGDTSRESLRNVTAERYVELVKTPITQRPEIVALPVVSEPPKRKPGRPPKAK
jgi:hypothetical protein